MAVSSSKNNPHYPIMGLGFAKIKQYTIAMPVSLKNIRAFLLPGLSTLAGKPAETDPLPVPPDHNFRQGDTVRLKQKNPFKGALKVGKTYLVQDASSTHIRINTDNKTMGAFHAKHFEPAGLSVSMIEAAEEYDEIMKIQQDFKL